MTYRKALDKMDRILEQNLLYDFYGELLTEHQQRVYEDAVYNDMSLSEIAGEQAEIEFRTGRLIVIESKD